MNRFRDFSELLAWLNSRGLFHMELGLGRMKAWLEASGFNAGAFRIIQVIGTNGKGSACAFLSSLSQASGYRTGLFISPHFISPLERILINDAPATPNRWLEAANHIFRIYPEAADLTYFEFVTCVALTIFASEKVQTIILEAGLGGKNDATSAIPAHARCFTPIAMDHARIIGPKIEDIAADKAAPITGDCPNFSAPQFPVARRVLEREAARKGAAITFVDALTDQPSSLLGDHQLINAAVALRAWQYLDPKAGRDGLKNAFIPGRMQLATIGYRVYVLDGAHNPHAMSALTRSLGSHGLAPQAVIYSCLKDKDWQTTLAILASWLQDSVFFFTTLDNPRALEASIMGEFFASIAPYSSYEVASFSECVARSADYPVTLVTGSLFLLAEFYTLYPSALHNTSSGD